MAGAEGAAGACADKRWDEAQKTTTSKGDKRAYLMERETKRDFIAENCSREDG